MKANQFTCVLVLLGASVGSGCSSESHDQPQPASHAQDAAAAAERGDEQSASKHHEQSAAAAEGCDAVQLDPPAEGEGIQLSIEMEIEPGKERQVCRLAKLDRAININWSEGRHSLGSHHGFTTKTAYNGEMPRINKLGESVEDASAVLDCESSSSNWDDRGVLAYGRPVGAANPAGKGLLPDDVAMKLAAGDIVQLNFHMINLGEKPVKACYKQNFYGIPDDKVRAEAGTIFWYNPFITVPANGSISATMACPITEDVTLADQVSHMHRRGVGYTASLLDADPTQGGKTLQALYDAITWDEPTERVNTPSLELKKGQWISFTCDYQNQEDRDVAQGNWTSDEMCMFIGTYWPRSQEMDDCASQGKLLGRVLASGDKSARELADCYSHSPKTLYGGGPESSEARYQTQKCITDSCPKASAHLSELLSGKLDPSTIQCD